MSLVVTATGVRATVALSGPNRNAIDKATWLLLAQTFDALSQNLELRVVVITGAGQHFAAGADITEFPELRGDFASTRHYHEKVIAPALQSIACCVHPTIAKIDGDCIGGGLEIAGCCDLRYASERSRFGVPIGRLGFPMAPDEMAALLRLAGATTTLELLLEARLFDAGEALARRLVTRVIPGDLFEAEIEALVARVTAQAPLAQRTTKKLLRALLSGDLSEAQRADAFSYAESLDHREGVAAFLERRAPHFIVK